MRMFVNTTRAAAILRVSVAAGLVLTMIETAAARDANSAQDFFSQMFSSFSDHAAPSHTEPDASGWTEPAPRVRSSAGRPLTVRMHRPKVVTAQGPFKPEKVSIFEDRTLRRGDAVMTAKGIRIFAGSTSWPYRPDDFVDLAEARHMDSGIHKVLAELDRMPPN